MSNEEFLEAFRNMFPEFENVTDSRALFFFELAKNRMSEKRWGKFYKEGVLYLSAHLLFMRWGKDGNTAQSGGAKQETTSKTIGKLSKGMSSVNSGVYANAGDLATTIYGRLYWDLLKSFPAIIKVF